MKTKFFWIICISLISSSIAFAQYAPQNITTGSTFERPGVDDEDKDFIMKDAEMGLEEHKKENDGKIDLTKFKPVVMKALYETFQAEEITRKELVEIRNAYEKLERDSKNMSQAQIEEALRKLFKQLFDKIQSTKLQCTGEGKQCNDWGCCAGLVCAAVPERAWQPMNNCKRFRNECKQDSDCCSGECVDDLDKGKKVCAAVRRCFKPGKAGASCDKNPVCGEGECLPFNKGLLGINECTQNDNKCASDDQCCSNKCNQGKCVDNFQCKNCVGQGVEPKRGQKCCEGLYKDPDTKKCRREMPPFVLPQVKVVPMKKSILGFVASLFISEAHAFLPAIPTPNPVQVQNAATNAAETAKAAEVIKNDQQLRNKIMMQQYYSGPMPGTLNKDANYKKHKLEEYMVREGSDFDKCEIDLKADYLIRLRDYGKDGNGLGGIDNAIGMEMALMAFEYMVLGEGVEDFWREDKNKAKTNVYQRMRSVAEQHRDNRHAIFKDLTDQSRRLQCLCWDKQGYTKLETDTQDRFKEQCPDEYAAYLAYRDSNPNMTDEDYSGDASGIKSQALMVRWLQLIVEIEGAMSIQNTRVFEGLNELASWANNNDWGNNEVKKKVIYNWTMATSGYQVQGGNYAPESMNMEQAAIVVAGVVGIIAGLASLTVWPGLWVSAGIIAGGASLGSAGMWLVGAMKGAWESRAPLIQDKSTRAYKCGKKTYCTDFNREFHVPYSKICNAYVSGNGCLKNFLVETIEDKDRYLVDPFIPFRVSKSKIIKDNTKFTDYFNNAYANAVTKYSARKPSGNQGQNYLKRVFIDALQVGQMAPKFRMPLKDYYKVTKNMRDEIKEKAMVYILDEGVFATDIGRCDRPEPGGECSGGQSPNVVEYGSGKWYFNTAKNAQKMKRDIDKLEKDMKNFSEYTYDFHWVWPRLAQEGMIAYPMPGFISYLELVSNTMGSKAAVNLGNVNDINNKLLKPQLQNMQLTCAKYVEAEGGTPSGTIQGDCNQMLAVRLEGAVVDKTAGNGLFDGMDDLLNNSVNYAGGFDLGAGNGNGSGGNMAFKGNRGGEGGSGNLSGGSVSGSGDSGLQGATKAKKRLREIRKQQLDKMEKFKEAVGAARANQLLNAQKAMVSSFNNPTGSGTVASLGSGGVAGILGNGSGGQNAAGKTNRNDLMGGGNLGSNNNGGVSIPKPNYDLSYNTGGDSSGGGEMSAEMSAAQDRLAEAVEYRDQNPEDYKKNNEGDTLWKIITRSYIRNYDKLLRKRKKNIDSGL
ncbi:MAG: hypothetical protein EP319_00870 [Deltaproteobacteria bacterium]|nr:MAG: hypothetical protein EP319_00870 [Deltaproteobacteria bacterium]